MKEYWLEFVFGIIIGMLIMLIVYPGIFLWVMEAP